MANAAILLALLWMFVAAGCGGNGGGGGEDANGELINPGLPAINLIAPNTTGAGEVPAFEWAAVNGADHYRLVVLDGNSNILWAWYGYETKVNLGGQPGDRPEGVGGPVIDQGSSWSVIAFDINGKSMATSEIRSVSP